MRLKRKSNATDNTAATDGSEMIGTDEDTIGLGNAGQEQQ